jgi:hypothetical protein
MSTVLALPEIEARFQLDSSGRPKFVESGGYKHYAIELRVQGVKPGTIGVVYRLDPTYYDAVRESTDARNGFLLHLTSYGDYTIFATLKSKPYPEHISRKLSEALVATSASLPADNVQDALNYIAGH